MRLGIALVENTAVEIATAADRHGLPAVLVPGGALGSGIALAAAIAALTVDTRIVVTVPLGTENPVTLAEEIAVVDHVSCGRIVVLVDTAALSLAEAAEDLSLLRQSWSGRWVRHRGARWAIPAGLHGDASPEAVSVTPWPAQLEMPVWLVGAVANDLGASTCLPVLLEAPPVGGVNDRALLVPGVTDLGGDLDADRTLLSGWAESGVSHLFARLPDSYRDAEVQQVVARFLAPEVATPNFPRIIAESAWPAAWPG
jgi:alkanesulfonate monooxygenase SsuD/methylene tetrahydromethanopterin reductase-like flavin-dependent oxidoreductase (luciferase family)